MGSLHGSDVRRRKTGIVRLPVVTLLILVVGASAACHSAGTSAGTGNTAGLEATIQGIPILVNVDSETRRVCLEIPRSASLSGHVFIALSNGGAVGAKVTDFPVGSVTGGATPGGGTSESCSQPAHAGAISEMTSYPGEFLVVTRVGGTTQSYTLHPAP